VAREHIDAEELEGLLDDLPGGGASAAWVHLRECDPCAASYARGRKAILLLEQLQYHTPPPDFADRVMVQVQLFEPLHVTVVEAARRLLPQGSQGRAAAATALAGAGAFMTLILVWLATRADEVAFLAAMLLERARLGVMGAVEQLAVGLVGESTAAALGLQGMRGVWLAAGVFGLSAVAAATGLRFSAQRARRGGS
jgi:hypothetical protein